MIGDRRLLLNAVRAEEDCAVQRLGHLANDSPIRRIECARGGTLAKA